jgi:hypothetical protein
LAGPSSPLNAERIAPMPLTPSNKKTINDFEMNRQTTLQVPRTTSNIPVIIKTETFGTHA